MGALFLHLACQGGRFTFLSPVSYVTGHDITKPTPCFVSKLAMQSAALRLLRSLTVGFASEALLQSPN